VNLTNFSIAIMTWGHVPPTASEIVEVTQHAEDLGFYSVGLPHLPILPHADENPPPHLIYPHQVQDNYLDTLVLLPMMAQKTTRVRIGINILIAAWLHPFVSAKYMASMDVVSEGRFIAGFGVGGAGGPGGVCKSLEYLGIPSGERGRMVDEALDLVTQLWTADAPMTFQGRYYRGTHLVIDPKPVQKPYPELWWAGEAKPSLARAAKYARFLELAWIPPNQVRDQYMPALEIANRAHSGSAEVATWLFTNFHPGSDLSPTELSRANWGLQGDRMDAMAAGSTKQAAEKIRAFHQAGVRHFVLDLHRHGFDHVRTIHDQMKLFVSEILPRVQDSV
jgi:alkanesulfonate monooxygenase SsuD/methylene tetrahydromethanopterin reductase-like flavin-dependent oxidoreductase (luciferase family)